MNPSFRIATTWDKSTKTQYERIILLLFACVVTMFALVSVVLHHVICGHGPATNLPVYRQRGLPKHVVGHNSDNIDALENNRYDMNVAAARSSKKLVFPSTDSYMKRLNPRYILMGVKNYVNSKPKGGNTFWETSSKYKKLRQEFDALYPEDEKIKRFEFVKSLRKRNYVPVKDFDNGELDCPLHPPKGYPKAWPIVDIIEHWNPDDTTPHEEIYQGICTFDFEKEYDKVLNYRNAEVPFVVRNDPTVLRTVERWAHPDYLTRLMGDELHRAEYSVNNHFMYWAPSPKKKGGNTRRPQLEPPAGWKAPTTHIRMSYPDWLDKANVPDEELVPEKPHWYFRLIGCGAYRNCDRKSSEFLFDEMPFFRPTDKTYIVDPEEQRGIHCRFGMKGVTAENHFDAGKNMIALLSGERRYILAHPEECPNLSLYPKEHPSGRHSIVDWTDPDLTKYPEFANAKGNEMVMQAGDVMYLPMNWFHYIVSLETNAQCNTRSGISPQYIKPIKDCGF